MDLVARILIGVVAALHLLFLVLEMFLWNKPAGLKVFKHTQEEADRTAVLAKNQGLYNGFLVAGLVWALLAGSPAHTFQLAGFFLGCVVVAGVYGAATAKVTILFLQALPGAIALGACWAAWG